MSAACRPDRLVGGTTAAGADTQSVETATAHGAAGTRSERRRTTVDHHLRPVTPGTGCPGLSTLSPPPVRDGSAVTTGAPNRWPASHADPLAASVEDGAERARQPNFNGYRQDSRRVGDGERDTESEDQTHRQRDRCQCRSARLSPPDGTVLLPAPPLTARGRLTPGDGYRSNILAVMLVSPGPTPGVRGNRALGDHALADYKEPCVTDYGDPVLVSTPNASCRPQKPVTLLTPSPSAPARASSPILCVPLPIVPTATVVSRTASSARARRSRPPTFVSGTSERRGAPGLCLSSLPVRS